MNQSIISNINGYKFNIKSSTELSHEDIEFIKNHTETIFCHNLSGRLWMFDTKLPSGRWLEKIIVNNDMTVAEALVL